MNFFTINKLALFLSTMFTHSIHFVIQWNTLKENFVLISTQYAYKFHLNCSGSVLFPKDCQKSGQNNPIAFRIYFPYLLYQYVWENPSEHKGLIGHRKL